MPYVRDRMYLFVASVVMLMKDGRGRRQDEGSAEGAAGEWDPRERYFAKSDSRFGR